MSYIDSWIPVSKTKYNHVDTFSVHGSAHNTEEFYRLMNPYDYD